MLDVEYRHRVFLSFVAWPLTLRVMQVRRYPRCLWVRPRTVD
jgi:hypothetical protein